MNYQVVFFLSINDIGNIAICRNQKTLVSYLSSSFWIKRSNIKHQMIKRSVLLAFYFSVFSHTNYSLQSIIPDEFFLIILAKNYPVISFHLCRSTRAFFLFL